MKLPTSSANDIETFYNQGRHKLALRLCIVFGLVFTLLSLTFITGSIEELLAYILCALIAFGSLIYLLKTKNYKPIYYFMTITGTLIAMYTLNNIDDVVHYGDFLWMVLVITLAFFGLGIKQGLVILVLNLGNVLCFSFFCVNNNVSELTELTFSEQIGLAVELSAATISIVYIIYQFVIFHKFAYNSVVLANNELTERNKVISSQNLENRTLIKEIHHRVKNNLQIVISLLRLQKAELKSEEAEKHFSEAINRIMVMSLIHKKLYQEGELATIELQSYLSDLANDINSLSSLGTPIDIDVKSEIEKIGLKTIVPLGLIINELISNSVRHAFINKTSGAIKIRLVALSKDLFTLDYSDNGTWLEPDSENTSFGLELLQIISEQLEGKIERTTNEGGTHYRIQLKNIDDDEQEGIKD